MIPFDTISNHIVWYIIHLSSLTWSLGRLCYTLGVGAVHCGKVFRARLAHYLSYFHQTYMDGAYWHTSGQNRLGCWNWARNIRNWWRFSDAGRGLGFWYRLTFLKQVPFDDHFKVIVRSIFIKRRWMMHLGILMQLNGLDAESDP